MSPTTQDNDRDRGDAEIAGLLDAVARGVRVQPGDLEAVHARAARRTRNRRGVVLGAGVVAVLVGALALPSVDLGRAPSPPVVDQPEPGPTASPEAWSESDDRPLAGEDWTWAHVRYGDDGVVVLDDGPARTLTTTPVLRALPLPDGRVIVQPGQGPEDHADSFVVLAADGAVEEVGAVGQYARLQAVRDDEVWWSARLGEPGVEGSDEEHLYVLDLSTGAVADAGASNGLESFTDALAFGGAGDTAAWLDCHLQCGLFVGALDGMFDGRGQPDPLLSGWLAGLALRADATQVATVVGPDPNVDADGAAHLHVLDVDDPGGATSVVLPRGLAWASAQLAFTPDGTEVLVSDADGAWVVDPATGSVRPLERADGSSDQGAALFGWPRQDVDPEPSPTERPEDDHPWAGRRADYEGVAWPWAGERAWDWTVAEGRRDDRGSLTDPLHVAADLLDFLRVPAEVRTMTVRDEVEDADGGATVDVEVSAAQGHAAMVVRLRRVADSPYWWVTDVEPAEGDAPHLATSAMREESLVELYGRIPTGAARVDVVHLGEVVAQRELATEGPDRWGRAFEFPEPLWRQPVAFAMLAYDADGRLLQVSVGSLPPVMGSLQLSLGGSRA